MAMVYINTSDIIGLIICFFGLASIAVYITFKYYNMVGFVRYYKLEKHLLEYKRLSKGL